MSRSATFPRLALEDPVTSLHLQPQVLHEGPIDPRAVELQRPPGMKSLQRANRQLDGLLSLGLCQVTAEIDIVRPQSEAPHRLRSAGSAHPAGEHGLIQLDEQGIERERAVAIAPVSRERERRES